MAKPVNIEGAEGEKYPGTTVTRDADAVVVRIQVRFYRRNGRQMVLTQGGDPIQHTPEREANGTLDTALAKAHRWQEQLESGQYDGLEDLAAANGVDRTYVARILKLTSLSPKWSCAILGRLGKTGTPKQLRSLSQACSGVPEDGHSQGGAESLGRSS